MKTLRSGELERASSWLRRVDAQNVGDRDRRSAPAPRARVPHVWRQRPVGSGHVWQGGGATEHGSGGRACSLRSGRVTMTERPPPARCVGVGSTGSVGNASAPRPAARRRGVVVTRLRCLRFQRDPRGQAPSMNAQCARRACLVSNIARTAGASAAASVRVDFAQRVTSRWRSPISSSREVIAQTHPDSRLWGNLMAAGGAELMTVYGEISRPPLGTST